MNLKSLIEKMDDLIALNEATKETPTGKIHKADPGGYGRKIDTDEEGEEKKAEKPAVKRGRGRPKKGSDSETGEVKKWDTETLQRWVVGSKPKTLPGKASVKHKIKDESLEEATKETPTGKVHKAEPGGYGRKFDIDDDGEEKKASKPAVKRGRGRPKKGSDSETGEVPQYKFSKDLQSFMIGNLPKGGLPGKPGKKHKLKDWMEHVETSMIVESIQTEGRMADVDIVIQDLINGNSDIYDVMNHPRDTEQQYVSKILHNMYERIAGEEGLHPDDDFEEIQSRILDELEREYGHQMNEEDVQEVAAPGQEDWIKSNKERFIKQYGKKKGMSVLYATAWKRSKQDESVEESVTESVESQKQPVMENKLVKLLSRYPYEYKAYQEGWGLDEGLYEALCEHYFEEGQIPHGVWTGALEELRSYVENKYVQDSQELMENPALAALLPAVARVVVAHPVATASVVGNVANAISDMISGPDEYEQEDDTGMLEGSRDDIARKIKTPPSMRKDKSPLSLSDVGTKAKYRVGNKEYNVGDETMARGTAKLTGKRVQELPETELEASLRDSVAEMEEGYMNESKEVEESGLQAYLGNKKYGKEGMDALRKAGREGASKEKMAKIRAKHDKLEEQDMAKDMQMEGWEQELNALLNEGLTVTTSTGQPGGSDSVSVSATDHDAHSLMKILQSAGLTSAGLSTGDKSPEMAVVSPVSSDEVLTQLGTDKEQSQDSGDKDMSFLKKMLGQREQSGYVDEGDDLEERVTFGAGGQTSGGWQPPADAPTSSAPAAQSYPVAPQGTTTSPGVSAIKQPVPGARPGGRYPSTPTQESEMEENATSQPADIKPGMTVDQAKATQSYKTNPNVRAEVDKADAFASAFDKKVPAASSQSVKERVTLGTGPVTSTDIGGGKMVHHGQNQGSSGQVSGPGLKPPAPGQPQQGLKVPPSMSTPQQTNEEDVEEGNAYTGARQAAIKAGKNSFTVGGKTHQVTGDTSDEKKMEESSHDDEDQLNESRCDECGMYESKCSCDHEKLDEWANSSDEDKQFKSDMDYMTRVLSGGLNNIKRDQTVLPSTKVKMESKKMGPNFTDLLKKFRDID